MNHRTWANKKTGDLCEEPDEWFPGVFRTYGNPWRKDEVDLIDKLNEQTKTTENGKK